MWPPFDASDADLSLHTPDDVTFKVYSRILALASPIFHDMFKLPQPDAAKNIKIPVVDVSESSEVMHALLRFIYPIEDPPVTTMSMLSEVLAAADKYNMTSVTQTLERLLIPPPIFVNEEPVAVYALACRYGLKEATEVAASRCLTKDVLGTPLTPELELITAYDYKRLLSLHQRRSDAAQKILDGFKCLHQCPGVLTTVEDHLFPGDWVSRAKEELRLRPTTDVIFSPPFCWMGERSCGKCGTKLNLDLSVVKCKERIDKLPSTLEEA